MGTLVTYRDLPGGPMKIKFADEISRHCLCRQCHMLSLCMYSDSASHMFCDDCLNDQSYKHKKYEIYCPDERKDVSLAQMFQARDLVTILCDQYVECPNQPKCTVKLPLGQLEKHYIECKEMSSIKCTKCGHKVPSTSWMEHKTDCQPTCDNELPRKKSGHRDGKRKPPPESSASLPVSASRKNGSAKNTGAAPSSLYPSSLLPDATTGEIIQQFPSLGSASTSTQPPVKSQGPASIEPEKTTCKQCGRNVKESNMARHLKVCYEVRTTCAYCDKDVARKDMKAHTEECMRKFEEAREASDAATATSGNSKKIETCHQKQQNRLYQPIPQPMQSYADALKHGKRTKSNSATDIKSTNNQIIPSSTIHLWIKDDAALEMSIHSSIPVSSYRSAPSPHRQDSKTFTLHQKEDSSAGIPQAWKISGSEQTGTKSSFCGPTRIASSQDCTNSSGGTLVAPEPRHEKHPRYMTRSQTKKLRDEEKSPAR
ncbi:uncharacterized protein LOC142563554 isoform X4 [Dermacentor variabilis]|uniref:uncharacterized protein LOC142563554 isoform X4 n=1 Tax=Dermacentor variabilis TaxID=34621 RepID=UPI003F5C8D58